MVATRQLRRADAERWLYRTGAGDFGPVNTDRIMDAIAKRKIDLATQVCLAGSDRWNAIAEHELFRNHFDHCRQRWEQEAKRAEIDRLGKRLERSEARSRHTWRIVGISLIAAAGIGVWMWWRFATAESLGIASINRMATTVRLPTAGAGPARIARNTPRMPAIVPHHVPRLAEPESYDTAGVQVTDNAEVHTATKLTFNDDGEIDAAPTISADQLAGVVESARKGLYACAIQHAQRDPTFSGTEVGLTVQSGHLGNITVGTEVRNQPAFRACVKSALTHVAVPTFGGGDKRVVVPLRIAR